ncbi:MAG: glycerophosphodiester phosphodiesterase [Clostridia bacterium]|nr:glycerophosphodiester phosphodiesterase [Clostridia bacterium]
MNGFIVISVTLLIFAALLLFLIFPAVRRHPLRAKLKGIRIAHRGFHDSTVPENSIASFRAALEHGYAIETDIHLTADGEVVVFHDDTLKRMCGIDRSPEDMTLAELRECKLANSDAHIPTLGELLNLVDGRVLLLIEFKCRSMTCAPLCEAADAILSQYRGDYMIQSFYPTVPAWYKKHRPEICRGQLSSAFYRDKFHMKLLGCLFYDFLSRPDFVSYEHTHKNNIFRRLATALGAYPIGWTFRTQEELEQGREAFEAYIFENFKA